MIMLAKNEPDHNEHRLYLMSGKTIRTKSSVTGGKPSSFRIPDWWRSVLTPSSLKDVLTSDSH